jgi:hypothetical protein
MLRLLGPVLGHAKLLAFTGVCAGSVAVTPVAVRAWHHHQQNAGYHQVASPHGGERDGGFGHGGFDRPERDNRWQSPFHHGDHFGHDRGDHRRA